ncbi:4-O-beta-D-mannosyl-D-glucose phosphorylase [Roseimaritima multifibrata]|uniref:4-O-beta-D-mannosyl-D-glucose phosphorylase n=1 Tax=Roseimaritima multifibrata TaxID=1930274 RepID=A0A517MHC5_9BACT|nr:hypothetical protein [Roseimaritima multifibrata]QDS94284.1 4-O-beta-D-mannosyl-D-glucose phosphorylase [Roseimaritima multifibrata]
MVQRRKRYRGLQRGYPFAAKFPRFVGTSVSDQTLPSAQQGLPFLPISPIETEAGWLVLTHRVDPMRQDTIGAILLDLDDPSRVIGRLKKPLLSPNENEREGYVPNVVYSCGAAIHNGHLILPYAMSDDASSFAIAPLNDLLSELTS